MDKIEYISPFSDFGFKNLYGKGKNAKENLIFLLNEVLKDYPGMSPIVDITYNNVENQGDSPQRKSTRFDVSCTTRNGERFVIEMQNEKERHLKQRLIFYMCQTVAEQDSRVNEQVPWNYDFPRVIVIMFCNFIDPEIDREEVNHFGILNFKTHREFGNHVGLTVLQLPLFPSKEEDCKTELEQIIFSMMHMKTLIQTDTNPFSKQKGDFYDRIKIRSTTAALTEDELHEYHQWLKVTNDDRLRLQQAEERGINKGRAEGEKKQAWESAKILYSKEMPLDLISEVTGISVSELQKAFS